MAPHISVRTWDLSESGRRMVDDLLSACRANDINVDVAHYNGPGGRTAEVLHAAPPEEGS